MVFKPIIYNFTTAWHRKYLRNMGGLSPVTASTIFYCNYFQAFTMLIPCTRDTEHLEKIVNLDRLPVHKHSLRRDLWAFGIHKNYILFMTIQSLT